MLVPGATHCDTLEWNNLVLHDIVAQQERMLQGRSGQIDLLKNRGKLGDLAVTDLEKRATDRITTLATDNTALLRANRQQAAELDRLRGRTWLGRLWRKTKDNVLAPVGLLTVMGITLKLVL